MNIKLIAIDIDGTLLNSQHQITSEVKKAIQEAKQAGVKVVIATGRPLSGVKQILQDLHLLEEGDYVITFNGGLVQETATGKDIVHEGLNYEDYLELEYLARTLTLPMHASTKEGIFTANRDIGKYTIYESQLVDAPVFYRTPEEMKDKEVIKVMMVDEPEKLDVQIPHIPSHITDKFNLVKSAPFYLEVTPKTVNKGKAIKHLCDLLGFSLEETMAIGDQENDRAMLEAAGVAVVMENGHPAIKEIATHITKSNDEDGVAYAIREWVL